MKKNKKLIPKGMYCYSGSASPASKSFKLCPYWRRKDERREQEDGYCEYLGKGDHEINREEQIVRVGYRQKDGSYKYEKINYGPDNPSFMSLLWDQCKDVNCPRGDK